MVKQRNCDVLYSFRVSKLRFEVPYSLNVSSLWQGKLWDNASGAKDDSTLQPDVPIFCSAKRMFGPRNRR